MTKINASLKKKNCPETKDYEQLKGILGEHSENSDGNYDI